MQTKATVFVEPIICEVFVDQITLINCEGLKEIGKMAFVESARSSREQTPKSLAQNEIYLTFTERTNGNKFAHKKAGLHGSKDLQVLILFLC